MLNMKKKKDRVILEKFPDAQIHTLLGKLKLTKSEKVIDNLLGFFTDAPFGTPELINSFKNMDKEFYLVEKDGKQFLVTITDEFIETRKLAKRITAEKFEIGNWKFTNALIRERMRMKKKIIGILVDIILFSIVFGVTDTVLLKVFHSESFWLELGIYLVLYTVAFGTKRGIIILWNKFVSKKKEGNENEKDQ